MQVFSKAIKLTLIMISVSIAFLGCRTITYNHPTKPTSMYEADKTACEKTFIPKSTGDSAAGERFMHIKLCMEGEGWVYSKE